MRCGKSTLLRCILYMVCRGKDSKHVTASVLFRTIELHHPTFVIDEADTISRDNDEIRCALNSSSEREGKITRSVGDDHEPRDFDVFTPIVYAMIDEPWETVLDRSIVIRMERLALDRRMDKARDRVIRPLFGDLGSKCARWALDARSQFGDVGPSFPNGLDFRAEDNWEPLLAIADLAGGQWPTLARMAATHLSGSRPNDDKSLKIRLLADIREAFEGDRMSSAALCKALVELEESPWARGGRGGKEIDASYLASVLKGFGITSKGIRIGDKTPKGYERAMFEKAFASYLQANPAATPQHETTQDGSEQSDTTGTVAPGGQDGPHGEHCRNRQDGQRDPSRDDQEQEIDPCCGVAAEKPRGSAGKGVSPESGAPEEDVYVL